MQLEIKKNWATMQITQSSNSTLAFILTQFASKPNKAKGKHGKAYQHIKGSTEIQCAWICYFFLEHAGELRIIILRRKNRD
jgi:hypothetical protein